MPAVAACAGQVPVLYPFGHGLSYADFAYSNLAATPSADGAAQTYHVSVTVANTGNWRALAARLQECNLCHRRKLEMSQMALQLIKLAPLTELTCVCVTGASSTRASAGTAIVKLGSLAEPAC